MPIHDYECEFCGHLFEELIRSDADEADLVCPKCGATKPRRRMSVTARVASGGPSFGGFGGGGCGAPGGSCAPGGG